MNGQSIRGKQLHVDALLRMKQYEDWPSAEQITRRMAREARRRSLTIHNRKMLAGLAFELSVALYHAGMGSERLCNYTYRVLTDLLWPARVGEQQEVA